MPDQVVGLLLKALQANYTLQRRDSEAVLFRCRLKKLNLESLKSAGIS